MHFCCSETSSKFFALPAFSNVDDSGRFGLLISTAKVGFDVDDPRDVTLTTVWVGVYTGMRDVGETIGYCIRTLMRSVPPRDGTVE